MRALLGRFNRYIELRALGTGIKQQDCKLLTTEPGEHISRAALFSHDVSEFAQNTIAAGIPMVIVDLFEIFDIEECDDGAASTPAQPCQFALQRGHEISMVEKTRQEISIGLSAQFRLIHDKLSEL